MPDDSIEIGESVDIEVVVDDEGDVVGAVVDDVIVATGPGGSIVDETVDILDDQGNVLIEDETVSVFDEDANLIAQEETVAVALDEAPTRRLNMIEAINDALDIMLERDPNVTILGEDVGYFGGVFRATAGLQKQFGKNRVFDTPINECGIIGAAVGMAAYGLRPVP